MCANGTNLADSDPVLTVEVADFLKRVPPFQLLEDEVLAKLGENACLEFYPKGHVILSHGGAPSEALQVIVTGGAKVSVPSGDGEEIVIDYRSEGDSIGYLSLCSGDRSRTNVTAIEDTTCYLIPREPFLALLDANPAVREYFHRTFISKYMDKAFADMRNRSLLLGGGEKLLFTTPVGELPTRSVVSAPSDISIRAAAEVMSRHRVSSLVLTDADGSPAGIVTDRDLRDKVAARGRDLQEPVAHIMTSTLIKADAMDYCFEALLTMMRHNIHHLLVVDHGRLKGVVTNHDLMVLQGTSPISVVRELEGQQDLDGLAEAAQKVNGIIGLLIKEGAKASNITHIITEINDRLVRKVIELVGRKVGPAPLPWCWMVFGSEGRKEQTFKTDQDNAIIYADPASPEEEAAAQEWFPRFAQLMKDALVRCGFAPCPADFMASNPRWTQPLGAWKNLFARWVANPGPEALLHSVIFFDFRGLGGDVSLAEDLRDHLGRTLQNQNVFFARMVGAVIRNRPPLGFFGSFVVVKGGLHKDELNLKISGLGPIVDIARVCALEAGARETNTLERLRVLRGRHSVVTRYGEELAEAFEFLSLLRVTRQWEQLQSGRQVGNFVNPDALTPLERKSLKDAFRVISHVQDLIAEDRSAGLVV